MKSKPVSRYLISLDPPTLPLIGLKLELDLGSFKNTAIFLGDFFSVAQLDGAAQLSAAALHMLLNPTMPPRRRKPSLWQML